MENENDNDKANEKSLEIGIDELDELVTVHKKIGSGTFSSVFLASLKAERKLKRESRKLLAIKRLIPTSDPRRIEQELKCLSRIGGVDNVGGIEACVRQRELVAFVMPFTPHDRFHDYFDKMDHEEIQHYLKSLLIALRRVHSFNIIHRDVKPSNFLYNRKKRECLLVDFGLAQEVIVVPKSSNSGLKRKEDTEPENNPPKRVKLEASLTEKSPFKSPLKQNQANIATTPLATAVKSTCLGLSMNFLMMDRKKKPVVASTSSSASQRSCFCYGKSQVCNICIVKREIQASRAGTPGYRPPEVLLKHPSQTTAVDIWSAGIIFLSILSKSYPFFRAHDDFNALAEMISLFGDKRFKQLAHSMSRHLKVGGKKHYAPVSLRKLCVILRRRSTAPSEKPASCSSEPDCEVCRQSLQLCLCVNAANDESIFAQDEFPPSAYDLLESMLELDPRKRITAEDALKHPYFTSTI